jgi:hypothetical protein
MNKLPMPWDKRDGKLSTRNVVIGSAVLSAAAVAASGLLLREMIRPHNAKPEIVRKPWQVPEDIILPRLLMSTPKGWSRKTERNFLTAKTPYTNFAPYLEQASNDKPSVAVAIKRGDDPWGVIDSESAVHWYEPLKGEGNDMVVGIGVDNRPTQAAIGIITPEQTFLGLDTHTDRRRSVSLHHFVRQYFEALVFVPPVSAPPAYWPAEPHATEITHPLT